MSAHFEGWGEGLSDSGPVPGSNVVHDRHDCIIKNIFALSFAPSPLAPLPMREGENLSPIKPQ
jgi:hypothetical protein